MTSELQRVTRRGDHRVAIVLGSGLSALAAALTRSDPIPYGAIQGMPAVRVPGHEGALYHGQIEGTPTLVFAGRVHLYEARPVVDVVRAVQLAIEAGCEIVVLTNAAGAIAPALEVGAPCLISDHLNLTGANPLEGARGAEGFLDMTEAYDRSLRALARTVDPELPEGVYAGLRGPSYETPAEVRMLAAMGADLVGMSTVLETIAARRLGARVMGISVVTNQAAGLSERPLNHEDVAAAGDRAAARLEVLLRGVLAGL